MAYIVVDQTTDSTISVYVAGMSSSYGHHRRYDWSAYLNGTNYAGGGAVTDQYTGMAVSGYYTFTGLPHGATYSIQCQISGVETGTAIDSITDTAQTQALPVTYYTITPQAGTGGVSVSGGGQAEYGGTVNVYASVASGYSFDGWYDGGGNYYGSSTSLSVTVTGDLTLYARASVSTQTLTLSYSANGGSGAPSSQSQSVNVGLNATFTISGTVPTRTGYTFQGWSTSSGAGSASYSPSGSITIASNITLYAVWSLNTYTVSYNANGGNGAPSTQIKTYGQTLTLSSVSPTRAGYRFKGWATSGTATTATYQPGGSYTQNAGLSLYAVWQEVAYYGIDGAWRPAVLYYGVDGVWVEGSAYVGSSGAWKNAE